MLWSALVSVPTDVDPVVVAMLGLRVLIVVVVVGVLVRGYLRRRRERDHLLEESEEWVEHDDGPDG